MTLEFQNPSAYIDFPPSFQVDSGVWFYELEVVTEGIMQVRVARWLGPKF